MTDWVVVARVLHFWALAPLCGGAGLATLVPAARSPAALRLLRLAALATALTGAAWFAAVLAEVAGDAGALADPEAWRAFLTAPFGPPWALRLVLLAAALAVPLATSPRAYLAIGALLAADQAWLGHAAAGTGTAGALEITAQAVHTFAALAWIGALAMLCRLWRSTRDVPWEGLSLLSGAGVVLVTIIVATGIVNAAFRLGAPADLVATAYGRLVCAKIALLSGMLIAALYNRRATHARRPGQLGASLAVETALGLATLAAAAVLGASAPPS